MAKGKYQKWLTHEGKEILQGWARSGLTEEQIARKMGVSRSTLNDWKPKYPDISDTLKKGKDAVDFEVENNLLKRARGYTYNEEVKERKFNRETGQFEMVVIKSVTKTVPPDTTALIFWLKNRRPDNWRDKQEVRVDGVLQTEKTKLDELLREIGIDDSP